MDYSIANPLKCDQIIVHRQSIRRPNWLNLLVPSPSDKIGQLSYCRTVNQISEGLTHELAV